MEADVTTGPEAWRPPTGPDVADDLRLRLRRLLAGERRADDLDRLYLGLRDRSKDLEAVREVGDFIAHRDTREKGVLTSVFRDVFTSLDVWSRPMRGVPVGRDEVTSAAQANLRLASDEQLMSGCGGTRSQVTTRLGRALAKIGKKPLKDSEYKTLAYLGTAFIWKPAFTAGRLYEEFVEAVKRAGLLGEDASLESLQTFLALHALTVMHGSTLRLRDDLSGRLWAGYANKDRCLEIKVEIAFEDAPKPIMAPVCLFYTELKPEGNCAAELISSEDPTSPWHWASPLEVSPGGLLTTSGSLAGSDGASM